MNRDTLPSLAGIILAVAAYITLVQPGRDDAPPQAPAPVTNDPGPRPLPSPTIR